MGGEASPHTSVTALLAKKSAVKRHREARLLRRQQQLQQQRGQRASGGSSSSDEPDGGGGGGGGDSDSFDAEAAAYYDGWPNLTPAVLLNVGSDYRRRLYFAMQSTTGGGGSSASGQVEFHGRFALDDVPLGRWTHVALCYDGRVVTKEDQARTRGKTGRQRFMSGKMSAYVDGVLQFEQPAVQHHPLKPPPASVKKTFAPEG